MTDPDAIADYVYSLALNHGYEVTELIIYGSYARSEATEDSDVDIIIVSSDFQEEYYERATDIHFAWDVEEYPIPDLIPLTPEEFRERRRAAEGDVVEEADRDGLHYSGNSSL